MATKHSVFRVTVTKTNVKVTGFSDVEAAMKAGNTPAFASAEELESGMSLAHINQAIHQLSGKPDTKPYEDPSKASKALWPLLKKKSAAGVVPEKETKEKPTKAPKAPKEKKAPKAPKAPKEKKPRVVGQGGNRSKTMTPTVKENPYRPGSKSFTAFQMVMDAPGKTFQHYVDGGARVNTLAHAIREGHIKLADPK